MKKLLVEVPGELLEWCGGYEEAQRWVVQATVAQLVRQRQISSGRAGELLGLAAHELPEWLTRFEVTTVELHPEDLEPF